MRLLKRITSLLTFLCFVAYEHSWAFSSLPQLQPPESKAAFSLDIPSSLASIQSQFTSSHAQAAPFIFHIQSAHAHYPAQIKIKEILDYLQAHYGVTDLFVEGASRSLGREHFQYFEDPKKNSEFADDLARQGAVTGPDLFVLEKGDQVRAFGLENSDLYREEYGILKKLFLSYNLIESALKSYESELTDLSSSIFSPELRRIFQTWRRWDSGSRDLIPVARDLAGQAQQILKIDLSALEAQMDWPNLTRLLALKKMEELKSEGLFEEIERLFQMLWGSLAKSPKEKELLGLFQDARLFRRLLTLRLSREEWTAIFQSKEEFSVPRMLERKAALQKSIQSLRLRFVPERDSEESELSSWFHDAHRFYFLAAEREKAFAKKIEASCAAHKIRKAAVITGGFHQKGLEELFRNRGFSYASLLPKVSGESEIPESFYRKAMLLGTDSRKSTAEVNSFFQSWSDQSALGREVAQGLSFLLTHYVRFARLNSRSEAFARFNSAPSVIRANSFLTKRTEVRVPRFDQRNELRAARHELRQHSEFRPRSELRKNVAYEWLYQMRIELDQLDLRLTQLTFHQEPFESDLKRIDGLKNLLNAITPSIQYRIHHIVRKKLSNQLLAAAVDHMEFRLRKQAQKIPPETDPRLEPLIYDARKQAIHLIPLRLKNSSAAPEETPIFDPYLPLLEIFREMDQMQASLARISHEIKQQIARSEDPRIEDFWLALDRLQKSLLRKSRILRRQYERETIRGKMMPTPSSDERDQKVRAWKSYGHIVPWMASRSGKIHFKRSELRYIEIPKAEIEKAIEYILSRKVDLRRLDFSVKAADTGKFPSSLRQKLNQKVKGPDFTEGVIRELLNLSERRKMFTFDHPNLTAVLENPQAGLHEIAGMGRGRDGLFILRQFYETYEEHKKQDSERGKQIFAALLFRLTAGKILTQHIHNTEISPLILEKWTLPFERVLSHASAVQVEESAIFDLARLFFYQQRFSGLASPEILKRYFPSSESRGELLMRRFDSRLLEVANQYYANRKDRAFLDPLIAQAFDRLRQDYKQEIMFTDLHQTKIENKVGAVPENVLRRIERHQPETLKTLIERDTQRYEEILKDISTVFLDKTIDTHLRRQRLARLNDSARKILCRLIYQEMQPHWISNDLKDPHLSLGSGPYRLLLNRLRMLRNHMTAYQGELVRLRVRQQGDRDMTAHTLAPEWEKGIGEFIQSEHFFVNPKKKGVDRYPRFLTEGTGTVQPDALRAVRDQMTHLGKGAVSREMTFYRRESTYYITTLQKLIGPEWTSSDPFLRNFMVEKLRDEEIEIPRDLTDYSPFQIANFLSSGPVYERDLTEMLITEIYEFLLLRASGNEALQNEIEARFAAHLEPDVEEVSAQIGEAKFTSIFDLLRSYNHALASYYDANIKAYDLIGFAEHGANLIDALRTRKIRNIPEMQAETAALEQLDQDVEAILAWALRGKKQTRTVVIQDAEVAKLAIHFKDWQLAIISLQNAQVHLYDYIEENKRISKFLSLKAIGLRDFIRRPVQTLLSGARIQEAGQQLELFRDRYLRPRFGGEDEFGYQRAKRILRLAANDFKKLEGRKILGPENPENKQQRRLYLRQLFRLSMVIYQVIYKKLPDDQFQQLQPTLWKDIEREILPEGMTFDQLDFSREQVRAIHRKVLRLSPRGEKTRSELHSGSAGTPQVAAARAGQMSFRVSARPKQREILINGKPITLGDLEHFGRRLERASGLGSTSFKVVLKRIEEKKRIVFMTGHESLMVRDVYIHDDLVEFLTTILSGPHQPPADIKNESGNILLNGQVLIPLSQDRSAWTLPFYLQERLPQILGREIPNLHIDQHSPSAGNEIEAYYGGSVFIADPENPKDVADKLAEALKNGGYHVITQEEVRQNNKKRAELRPGEMGIVPNPREDGSVRFAADRTVPRGTGLHFTPVRSEIRSTISSQKLLSKDLLKLEANLRAFKEPWQVSDVPKGLLASLHKEEVNHALLDFYLFLDFDGSTKAVFTLREGGCESGDCKNSGPLIEYVWHPKKKIFEYRFDRHNRDPKLSALKKWSVSAETNPFLKFDEETEDGKTTTYVILDSRVYDALNQQGAFEFPLLQESKQLFADSGLTWQVLRKEKESYGMAIDSGHLYLTAPIPILSIPTVDANQTLRYLQAKIGSRKILSWTFNSALDTPLILHLDDGTQVAVPDHKLRRAEVREKGHNQSRFLSVRLPFDRRNHFSIYRKHLQASQNAVPQVQVARVASEFVDPNLAPAEIRQILQQIALTSTRVMNVKGATKGGWVVELRKDLPSMDEMAAYQYGFEKGEGRILLVRVPKSKISALKTEARHLKSQFSSNLRRSRSRFQIHVLPETSKLDRPLSKAASLIQADLNPGRRSFSSPEFFVITGESKDFAGISRPRGAAFLLKDPYDDSQLLTASHRVSAVLAQHLLGDPLNEFSAALENKATYWQMVARALKALAPEILNSIRAEQRIAAAA